MGLSSSGSLPVEHTLHTGRGRRHRGPQSGGERKYKEGSSGSRDRSDRSNTDIFSVLFCGLSSSMVPTASGWKAMEVNSLGFFRFESPWTLALNTGTKHWHWSLNTCTQCWHSNWTIQTGTEYWHWTLAGVWVVSLHSALPGSSPSWRRNPPLLHHKPNFFCHEEWLNYAGWHDISLSKNYFYFIL